MTTNDGRGGPGTEINRTRAARNGFTFAGPALRAGESAILRLDNTGDEPVASASRDGGQTWEDALRWPDTLPGVVVMSAWHRPDGALVAEGSDGVDRVTAPHEIRTPEDADRLFGVGFGLGRWMREQAAKRGPLFHMAAPGDGPRIFDRVEVYVDGRRMRGNEAMDLTARNDDPAALAPLGPVSYPARS